MDVFAHTLWVNAGARKLNKGLQKKNKKPISVAWTVFWGVFPDLFAFAIPMIISLVGLLSGSVAFGDLSHHGVPGQQGLSDELYNFSHSLVIFGTSFLLTWLFLKRPPYELLGWALHVLLDIPTHRIDFYPTPFLFPISEYRFPYGISWGDTWFMIVNYIALALVFIPRILKKRKLKNK